MILKKRSQFEGYHIINLMERTTPYREVYRARKEGGEEFFLIVYDMNNLPECFNGIVPELEVIPILSQEVFPKFQDKGYFKDKNMHLRWVATEYIKGHTLTQHIKLGKVTPEKEILENLYSILVGLKEISWRLNKGSHNNINTDNIIISTDEYGKTKWYLVGLSCISEPCMDNPDFDTSPRHFEFSAPETYIGIYKQSSDIFSLGIVLYYALQHCHPWKDIASIPKSGVAKHFRNVAPAIELESSLLDIVKRAINPKVSERYSTFEELGRDIATYLNNEDMSSFECFGDHYPHQLLTPLKI